MKAGSGTRSLPAIALAKYESVEHRLTSAELLFEGTAVKVENRETTLCKVRVYHHLLLVAVQTGEDSGEKPITRASNGNTIQLRESANGGSESIYFLPGIKAILDTDVQTKKISIHFKYLDSRFSFEASSAERFSDLVGLWNAIVHQVVLCVPSVRVAAVNDALKVEVKRTDSQKMVGLVDLILDLKLTGGIKGCFPQIDYVFETSDTAGYVYHQLKNVRTLDDTITDGSSGLGLEEIVQILFEQMLVIFQAGYIIVPLVFSEVYTVAPTTAASGSGSDDKPRPILLFQNLKNLCSCVSYAEARMRVHISNLVSVVISYIKTHTESETGPFDPRHEQLIDRLHAIHRKLLGGDLNSFSDVLSELQQKPLLGQL